MCRWPRTCAESAVNGIIDSFLCLTKPNIALCDNLGVILTENNNKLKLMNILMRKLEVSEFFVHSSTDYKTSREMTVDFGFFMR